MARFGKRTAVRFRQAIRRFGFSAALTWIAAGLGFLTIAIPLWSIERADWTSPEPSLITALGLAAAAVVILTRFRLHGFVSTLLLIVGGIAVATWQGAQMFAPANHLSALAIWWQTFTGGRPSESPLFFVMFLSLITWTIGSVSLWFILRRRNAWPAAILGTVMLLVNLGNVPRDMFYFFPLFFLCAVVLLAVTGLAEQGRGLVRWHEKYVRRGSAYFAVAVVSVALVAVSLSYFVPAPPIDRIGLKLDTSTISGRDMQQIWYNIFAAVRSKWPTMKSQSQETLRFKDPPMSGDRIQFIVSATRSDYWRTRRYDVYESWGWESTLQTDERLKSWESIIYEETPPHPKTVTYTVENRVKGDLVLSQGEVYSADIPLELQTFASETGADTPNTVRDVAAIVSANLLAPYQRYRVSATISDATSVELTGAGDDYPQWLLDHYLQLPDSLPAEVKTLAATVTADARTAYDKAIAIKNYLRRFVYDEQAQVPPVSSDGVDYFLFSAQRGVCTNFASAMAVMLRSVGVPTRLATGYFRGEFDQASGTYTIRGQNYHAWVEVYFPEYGWIDFEATPATPEPGTAPTIEDNGYNFSFAGPEELPFWMIEPGFGGVTGAPAQQGYQSRHLPMPYLYLFGALTLIVVVVVITREVLGTWVKGLQHAGTVPEVYDRMVYLARRGNTGPFDHETPAEFGRRLTRYLPGQEDTIGVVTQAYLGYRYSQRKTLEERDKIRMQKAWVELTTSLVRHMLRLRKWALVRLIWKP